MFSITLMLVIGTALISFYAFQNTDAQYKLLHFPFNENNRKEYYRMLTAGFVHADWFHLIVNMFTLYSFGSFVEQHFIAIFDPTLGKILYLICYLFTITAANVITFAKHKRDINFMSLGASGGVSGILFIAILLDPWNPVYIYAVIGIWGILFGVLYLWYSSYASRQSGGRIDHLAHFYGAIFGVLFFLACKPSMFMYFIDRLINDAPFR